MNMRICAAGLCVAVMAVTLVARYSMAEDTQKINGVLIDAKCGKAKNTEEKAAGHPAACVTKCGGGGSARRRRWSRPPSAARHRRARSAAYRGSAPCRRCRGRRTRGPCCRSASATAIWSTTRGARTGRNWWRPIAKSPASPRQWQSGLPARSKSRRRAQILTVPHLDVRPHPNFVLSRYG